MKKLFSSKKAQITIFIIIGIILLFSSALIFYIKNKVTGEKPDGIVIQQQLPEDLEGLKKYIEQCVYTTGKQAVTILGSQGGYIYPQEFGVIGDIKDPTEGSGIYPFPNIQNYIVPYWYYLESPNTCAGSCMFTSKRPTLSGDDPSSIESQISRYVVENLEYCISDFGVYKNMGYTIKLNGPLSVKTTIARSDVVLDVNWPMLAGQENKKELKQFLVHLPVELKNIYNFADKILYLQQNQSVFETHTLNIILAYAADRLPSTGKLSYIEIFSSGAVQKWSFIESKKIVVESIADYTQAITVKNTLNLNYDSLEDPDPIIKAAKRFMVLDTNSTDVYPYEVNFRYSKSWPLYFDITPREGDIVKGENVDFGVLNMIGMAIKKYQFQYDISYPVVSTINDPEAFYGEGYDFTFAFESNIRNNRVLKSNFYSLAVDSKIGFECDEAQRKTKNITVNVTNGKTGAPLNEAVVSVYFGKKGCTVGNTGINGLSIEKYPTGLGELIAKKPDFLSNKTLFAAKQDTLDNYNFTLFPFEEKKIVVKKMLVKKSYSIYNYSSISYCISNGWALENTSTAVDLLSNESMSVFFKRVQTKEAPDMSVVSVTDYTLLNNDQSVKLVPGKYELKIFGILNKNITIPSKTKTYEYDCDWTGDCDEETVLVNGSSQNPYQEGVLSFDNSTFYFDVKAEELYDENNYLEIYALVYDLDSVPLICRDPEPSDFAPSPNEKTILLSRKTLLTPKFKNING